jgi:hypothetical protein
MNYIIQSINQLLCPTIGLTNNQLQATFHETSAQNKATYNSVSWEIETEGAEKGEERKGDKADGWNVCQSLLTDRQTIAG